MADGKGLPIVFPLYNIVLLIFRLENRRSDQNPGCVCACVCVYVCVCTLMYPPVDTRTLLSGEKCRSVTQPPWKESIESLLSREQTFSRFPFNMFHSCVQDKIQGKTNLKCVAWRMRVITVCLLTLAARIYIHSSWTWQHLDSLDFFFLWERIIIFGFFYRNKMSQVFFWTSSH